MIKSSFGGTNSAIFKTGGGCLSVQDVECGSGYEYCQNLILEVVALVKAMFEIDRVVIGVQWYGYLSSGIVTGKQIGRAHV